MADRVYQTEAVVLHRHDVGEHDRLLLLATPLGKRRASARGVRKTTSKLAGHLELFTHLTVQLAVGRSRDTLTQSVVLQSFPQLHADLLRIACAYYCAELYDRMTADADDNTEVFSLLVVTFAALDRSQQPELMLRVFELQLLSLLGYHQFLQTCPHCDAELTPAADRYSVALGGVVCPHHRTIDPHALPMSAATFRFLRFAQRESPTAIGAYRLSETVLDEARRITAAILRTHLDRDLQSARLVADVLLHQPTPARESVSDRE